MDYFLLDYVSGDAADFDAREVSGAEWFSWDEGIAKLSFENERRVVRAGARDRRGRTARPPAGRDKIGDRTRRGSR